jgi:hypothetical protein
MSSVLKTLKRSMAAKYNHELKQQIVKTISAFIIEIENFSKSPMEFPWRTNATERLKVLPGPTIRPYNTSGVEFRRSDSQLRRDFMILRFHGRGILSQTFCDGWIFRLARYNLKYVSVRF